MMQLSTWAGRNAAAVALTLAYTIVGPAPGIVAAMERVYAVAMIDDRTTRRDGTIRRRPQAGPWRPRQSHPRPTRP
jgi:hypothetical protein